MNQTADKMMKKGWPSLGQVKEAFKQLLNMSDELYLNMMGEVGTVAQWLDTHQYLSAGYTVSDPASCKCILAGNG